jgi:hypothetical protein
MTKLLERALEAARRLSPDAQDDIARVVLRLTGTDDGAPPVPLSAEERTAISASQDAAARGEFATDEQVRAPCGINTGCEASLYPSGPGRPDRNPRLHRRPFTARS